jgi:NADH:ubiquinone oxidoreductase subunit 3 (subunit A)
MMTFLLSPPVAILIYIPLVTLLAFFGRALASKGPDSPLKSGDMHTAGMHTALYSSGEEAPGGFAAPGYQPFFLIALFFAILHLGILVMGRGGLTPISGVYLLGLVVALLALMLG